MVCMRGLKRALFAEQSWLQFVLVANPADTPGKRGVKKRASDVCPVSELEVVAQFAVVDLPEAGRSDRVLRAEPEQALDARRQLERPA